MTPTSAPVKARRGNVEGAERLRRVVARLGRALRPTHVGASLSPSQREVLNTIVRRGPLRLSELAAEEGLNPTDALSHRGPSGGGEVGYPYTR